MKISKFVKVDKNILIEYIYDDLNLVGENYKVLVNTNSRAQDFVSADNVFTINNQSNQLFVIDPVANKYGLVDTTNYNFLQVKDFPGGAPIRYDIIKVHFPVNYTFDDKQGFHINVYSYDSINDKKHSLSNFFFDKTVVSTATYINFASPPILFQEKLWGKNIEIKIPALSAISNQLSDGKVKINTINYNLTSGIGLSTNAPVFINFSFIKNQQVINGVKTYNLSGASNVSVPQSPDFESIAVRVDESAQGDYFEIYGTHNGSLADFKKFIDTSARLGNRYYVLYTITIFEENIRGKTINITVIDNFNDKIEFRPIIKFSTTTAVIDVEMKLIDAVDDSQIVRRSAYGMLPDQVSKYSLNLTKINISNATKPKIFNIKKVISDNTGGNVGGIQVEQVNVPFPVLINTFNVVAKSESITVGSDRGGVDRYLGIGKMMLTVYPFDNVIKFIIANKIDNESIDLMDLTGGEIKLVFKNGQASVESKLFNSEDVDLKNGIVVFKISQRQVTDIRKIYDSGINLFYITLGTLSNVNVVYSGVFVMYDSQTNVNQLNTNVDQGVSDNLGSRDIIIDNSGDVNRETAIITRRVVVDRSPIVTDQIVTGDVSATTGAITSAGGDTGVSPE